MGDSSSLPEARSLSNLPEAAVSPAMPRDPTPQPQNGQSPKPTSDAKKARNQKRNAARKKLQKLKAAEKPGF